MIVLRCLLFLAIAGIALAADPALARYTLSGEVHDPAGGAVPEASISLFLPGGTLVAQTLTGPGGAFRFNAIRPGAYEVQVVAAGFQEATVALEITRTPYPPLRIPLKIHNLQQEVSVTDSYETVSAEPASNSDAVVVSRELLDYLPVMDDDVIGALSRFLDPGAAGTGGASLVIDGLESDKLRLSPSAIQEVKINQNPYSAEYSSPGRGRIEVITKQETDQYHGSFSFRLRDWRLNARNAFAARRPEEQRRGFEGHFTGPLGKSRRTSFLVSAEREEQDEYANVFARTPRGILQEQFPTPSRETEFSARINHRPSEKTLFSIQYESERESDEGRGVGGFHLPETASDRTAGEHSVRFKHQYILGPSVIHELQVRLESETKETRSLLSGSRRLVVQDAFTSGGGQADEYKNEHSLELQDLFTWSAGRHFVRAGASLRDLSRRGFHDRRNREGTYYFSSLEDHAAGRPYAFEQQQGDGRLNFWTYELAGFIQDDFRLRPNLTLGLGLRINQQKYLAGRNIAPRLSAAWSPGEARNTVLRAGVGIFYDRMSSGAPRDTLLFDGSRFRQLILAEPGYPNPFAGYAGIDSPPPGIVRFAPDIESPYAIHSSLGIERRLGKGTSLSATYYSVSGRKILRSRDLNAPFNGTRPNPSFGLLRQIETSGSLQSHSLQVSVRGDLTRYFNGMVRYAAGRAYNDTEGIDSLPADSYDLSGEWARASFNRPHQFDIAGTLKPGRWFRLGIQLGLDSGRPYSLTTGRDDNGDGIARDRPAGVPRNTLQGPGSAVVDLRWSRDFNLSRRGIDSRVRATLALDAFNVLNRVNYSSYVGNQSSPFFGRAASARPARRLQVLLRVRF